MFRIPEGDVKLYEFVFKVTFNDSRTPTSASALDPDDPSFQERFAADVIDRATPVDFCHSQTWRSEVFFSYIRKDRLYFVYFFPLYEDSRQICYGIISEYLHVKFMGFLLSEFGHDTIGALDQCRQYARLTVLKSKYDSFIESIPQFPLTFAHEFSEQYQLASAYSCLLRLLPPFLLSAVIVSLFADLRLVVVSASLPRLSNVVFGISQLLFPLQSADFLVPVEFLKPGEANAVHSRGPVILALHASLRSDLKETSFETTAVLDVDLPYLRCDLLSELPPPFRDAMSKFHQKVTDAVTQKAPTLPVPQIHTAVKAFIVDLLGPCLGSSNDDFGLLIDVQRGRKALDPLPNSVAEGRLARAFVAMATSQMDETEMQRQAYFPEKFGVEVRPGVPFPPRSRVAKAPASARPTKTLKGRGGARAMSVMIGPGKSGKG
jgi:hypothetical protein